MSFSDPSVVKPDQDGITLPPADSPESETRDPDPVETQLSLSAAFYIFFIQKEDDESLLRAYFKIFWPVLPFYYKGGKFVKGSKGQYWCCAAAAGVTLFQLLRFSYHARLLIKVSKLEDTFILLFWVGAYASNLTHLFNAVYNQKQLLQTANTWKSIKGGDQTAFTFLLRTLIPIAVITTLVNCLLFLYVPNKPYFIISEFNITRQDPYFWFPYFPIFLFYEFMSGYIKFGIHLIHDAWLLGWLAVITGQIQNLSSGSQGSRLTKAEVEKYRSLQIFEALSNKAMNNVFLCGKLIAYIQIAYVIIMSISGIATWNVLHIAYGIPQVTSLSLRIGRFLHEMSAMRSKSIELLEKWKNEKTDRKLETGLVLVSCRSLKYSAGDAYEIKENTILTFGAGTMDQTLGLLVAIKAQNLL